MRNTWTADESLVTIAGGMPYYSNYVLVSEWRNLTLYICGDKRSALFLGVSYVGWGALSKL